VKILFTNDWHLLVDTPRCRKDDAYATLVRKVEWIMEYAADNGAIIVIAGDVTDKSRSWRLLAAWTPVFEKYRGKVRIFAVYGQHDTRFYNVESRSATVLGNFIQTGLVEPLYSDRPVRVSGDVCLWGVSYGDELGVSAATQRKMCDSAIVHVLAIHDMIVPKKLWSGQTGAIYAPEFLNKNIGFDVIACGDCHRRFVYKAPTGKSRYIVNAGCLIRKTAERYNFTYKPGVWEFDSGTLHMRWVDVPHESADVVLSREHIDEQESRNERLMEFIGAVKSGAFHSGTDFISNLVTFCKSNKVEKPVVDMIRDVIGEEFVES